MESFWLLILSCYHIHKGWLLICFRIETVSIFSFGYFNDYFFLMNLKRNYLWSLKLRYKCCVLSSISSSLDSRPLIWKCQTVRRKDFQDLQIPWNHHRLSLIVMYNIFRLLRVNEEMISVQFSHSVISDSLRPHESQHTRPPCPSPTPGVHSNSHPSSRWCHPASSSSVFPFSSCPQSLPAYKES